MNQEESIQVIKKMIAQAKGNMKESSYFFILWGWVTIIGNMGMFLVHQYTNYEHPQIIWLIFIPAATLTFMKIRSLEHQNGHTTYAENVIKYVWLSFGISIALCIIFGPQLNNQIIALIMILTGMATFITGALINYKPLLFGALSFWIFVPVIFLIGGPYTPVFMSISVVFGYLIPAYRLKYS